MSRYLEDDVDPDWVTVEYSFSRRAPIDFLATPPAPDRPLQHSAGQLPRFDLPPCFTDHDLDNNAQPRVSERHWARTSTHDQAQPHEALVPARKAQVPRYTIEGNTHLPRTRPRGSSESSVVSRIFSGSIRSVSSASSVVSRRVSEAARVVSGKTKTVINKITSGVGRIPRHKTIDKAVISRPVSTQYSQDFIIPSGAHDAAAATRTDFSSMQITPSSMIGRLSLVDNYDRLMHTGIADEAEPLQFMPSTLPAQRPEKSPSSPSFSHLESAYALTTPPRRARESRGASLGLRRRAGTSDLRSMSVSHAHLFPEDDATNDYQTFIAAARMAEEDRLRSYRMRETPPVIRDENNDNISGLIDQYLRSDQSNMLEYQPVAAVYDDPFVTTQTQVPLRKSADRQALRMKTPSAFRASFSDRGTPSQDRILVATPLRPSGSATRRKPVPVRSASAAAAPQQLHRAVFAQTGEEIYFL